MPHEADSCVADNRVREHQLVVIGNGFDKACGLRSSFYEFFSPRIEPLDCIDVEDDEQWAGAVAQKGLTAWDLILQSRKNLMEGGADVAWCDVEAAIADVVQASDAPAGIGSDTLNISSIERYFNFIESYTVCMRPTVFIEKLDQRISTVEGAEQLTTALYECYKGEEVEDWTVAPFEGLIDRLRKDEDGTMADAYECRLIVERECPNAASEQVGVFLRYCYPSVLKWNAVSIREVLLEELHHLENAFNCYLFHEVSENEQYAPRAASLFNEICRDSEDLGCSGVSESITLLNFNYTELLSSNLAPSGNVVGFNQINVHGRLGHELIIGIDGSGCLSEAGQVRFSKTFRLLQLREPSIHGTVAYPANADVCGGMKTVAVKIFGHSLAPADYSYFQSIFDAVDLYSSDMTLCFYYTLFKENALDELLVNIANLLGEYGRFLDNQSHGRNLMHKLLLERRLVVREIAL